MSKSKESPRNFALLGWLQALIPYSPLPWFRLESATYAWAHLQTIDSPQDLWRMLTFQQIGRGAFPYSGWPANPADHSESDPPDRRENSGESEEQTLSTLLSIVESNGAPPDIQPESPQRPHFNFNSTCNSNDGLADDGSSAGMVAAETVAVAGRNRRLAQVDDARVAPAGHQHKDQPDSANNTDAAPASREDGERSCA